MNERFGKKEKLKSQIIIGQVFEEGNSLKKFPLKLVYLRLKHSEDNTVKTAVSVPKKLVKTAVARNRIKRLMREAFRKNKYLVSKELPGNYALMFIYISREETELKKLESQMQKLLRQLVEKEGQTTGK